MRPHRSGVGGTTGKTEPMSDQSQRTDAGLVSGNRGWFIVLGIVMIVLGALAILFPWIMTLAAELLVGIALVIGGATMIVHAFSERSWGGVLWEALLGILYLVGGLYFLFLPGVGAVALTVALSAIFIVDGILRAIMGTRLKPRSGWGWLVAGGVVSAILGVMLFAGLPGTAVWAIGLLLGINLVFSGAAFLALGASAGGGQAKMSA